METKRTSGPYIWVTWLTKLLVGENSCEWAAWFKAQHEPKSWQPVLGDFDRVPWQMRHTALLQNIRGDLESQGYSVFTEHQNSFTLRGKAAALGGKPDIIAVRGSDGLIVDAKTGTRSPSHHVQVMVYMYAVPNAMKQYEGVRFEGRVVYEDGQVEIPASAIDETFVKNLGQLVQRIASATPGRRVPSVMECGFCNIPSVNCPERTADDKQVEGQTNDF